MDIFGNFYNFRTYYFNDIFGKCLEISKHILPMIFLETFRKIQTYYWKNAKNLYATFLWIFMKTFKNISWRSFRKFIKTSFIVCYPR